MAQSNTSPAKPLGKNGFRYRPQWGLVILCKDERHQAQLHRQLTGEGHKVRVVAV